MFENRSRLSGSSDRHPPILEQHSLASIKDSISSITYRVSEIQAAINRKIDRSQCLAITDKKVSLSHLKHYLEELQSKIREDHKQEEERNAKMQQIAIQKINDLGNRLKSVRHYDTSKSDSKMSRNKGIPKGKQRLIKPQQLFLESNETMFSLLIDEVAKLQEKDIQFEKQLENRNKKIINLNNQVCKKIQKLENELEEKIRIKTLGQPVQAKYFGNSWSQVDRNNKPTIHKGSEMEGSTFQSIRFQLISKKIQALQNEMLSKINIKDILPIIRQNTQSYTDSMQELRDYVEQSMESTRKIFFNQTQINCEMSQGIKIGWWHSFAQQNEIAIFNKQIINLVPEIFEFESHKQSYTNFINIAQQGLYLIKIYSLLHINNFLSDHSTGSQQQQGQFEVMIGTEVHILGNETVLRLQKNSEIRIILRNHSQIVLYLQKL